MPRSCSSHLRTVSHSFRAKCGTKMYQLVPVYGQNLDLSPPYNSCIFSEHSIGQTKAHTTSMVVSGSPKRWDRWHSPSPNWQEKYHLYTTYSPCRTWGVKNATDPTFEGNHFNNHWPLRLARKPFCNRWTPRPQPRSGRYCHVPCTHGQRTHQIGSNVSDPSCHMTVSHDSTNRNDVETERQIRKKYPSLKLTASFWGLAHLQVRSVKFNRIGYKHSIQWQAENTDWNYIRLGKSWTTLPMR